MDITDISKGNLTFSQVKNPEIPGEASDSIGEIGKEKIEALKNTISDIKELIVSREKLSLEVVEEGEKIKTEINNFLLSNEGSGSSGDIDPRDSLREKNDLRYKKISISEMQLNEKITCWKDVALLKKELRLYEKELEEKEGRMVMLNKILEEN